MLNLFDHLTEKDNTLIYNYITTYGITEDGYVGNETWLQYWKQNKPKLFHLLGGNLIYKVPFEYNVDEKLLRDNIQKLLYTHHFVSLYKDVADEKKFHEEMFTSNLKSGDACSVEWDIKHLLSYPDPLAAGKIRIQLKFKLRNKKNTLQISPEMKPMRAIQAILNYFDCFSSNKELMDAFEDFKKAYSMVVNTKKMTCNMCFSIHPLDFMTISDNANKWNSCMNWTQDGGGCYHLGTVEMMNSNNVICVYLDSSDPYIFSKNLGPDDEGVENYTWNNKKWRQLFYCTKEIIVGGKAYPYQNKEFTYKALEVLRELAKENWNQTYEYGIEQYKDMIHVGTMYRMDQNKWWIANKRTKKHNIIFDTKGMYNDMLNDQYTPYYCIRNKVKKNTVISYSGKAPCLCCMGEILEYEDPSPYYEGAYNDRYAYTGQVICNSCLKDRTCSCCGETAKPVKAFKGNHFCETCWNERVKICPDCGETYAVGFEDEYYGREDIIYVRHINRNEWEYKHFPALNAGDDCVHHDAQGNPAVSIYNTCQCCLEKLKNSSEVTTIKCRYPWAGNVNIHTLKNIVPFKSEKVQKHLMQNLQKVQF